MTDRYPRVRKAAYDTWYADDAGPSQVVPLDAIVVDPDAPSITVIPDSAGTEWNQVETDYGDNGWTRQPAGRYIFVGES